MYGLTSLIIFMNSICLASFLGIMNICCPVMDFSCFFDQKSRFNELIKAKIRCFIQGHIKTNIKKRLIYKTKLNVNIFDLLYAETFWHVLIDCNKNKIEVVLKVTYTHFVNISPGTQIFFSL